MFGSYFSEYTDLAMLNTHTITLNVNDLKTERENYFNKIETVIKETEKKIEQKCIQNSIDEDKKFTKYKDDLMNNITHVFK